MASVRTKVLLVNDDPDLQDILQICLRQWEFEVASAANGDEGARLAESFGASFALAEFRTI